MEFNDRVVVFRLSDLVDGSGVQLLRRAIERYDAQAIGYVLDLRGNPGGLAVRMAEVAGFFMRGVPWRMVTKGLGVAPLPTTPPFGQPLTQRPLVVLIDGEVNSAAEGLAGALKNARRAYLIGTRTAGNTELLLPYCFPDGAVALVASGVLAPFSGPTWEGRGVEPDRVVEKDPLAAALEYLKRLR
ncbi:putative CtpA-like serine protease [Calidithermus terrae]|uniref:Putative CtpA-like serine protease n=1 Tax=Calidithermus terrae TaxID=1408545 RepID=A0A399EIC5_9DEIN|nr:putative CtpA-like serine protease [Calidithermus terrae]